MHRLRRYNNEQSVFVPWFRATGGVAMRQLNHALQWAYDGYIAATFAEGDDELTVQLRSGCKFASTTPTLILPGTTAGCILHSVDTVWEELSFES